MKKIIMIMLMIIAFLSMAGASVFAQEITAGVVDQALLQKLIELGKDTDGDKDISIAEMEAITGELSLTESNILNITGLEHAVNITSLSIYGNQVSDILPITNLTRLQYLYIDKNKISDISYLSNLTNLEILVFDENEISDISSIANLTNLYALSMDDNIISDLSPVVALKEKLTWLEISGNGITGSDLLEISGLTNLEKLRLENNAISDVTNLSLAISGLTNLQSLYIDYNTISDVSPLYTLPNLNFLRIRDNEISDISSLSSIPNLEYLYLNQTNLSDLTDLFALNKLKSLGIKLNNLNRSAIPQIQTIIDNNPSIQLSKIFYNIIPNRIDTVLETTTASTYVGNQDYEFNLETIFEDADADSLTYKVSINNGAEIEVDENYSYMPNTSSVINFVFLAKDREEYSTDTYRVQLTIKPIPPKPDIPTMASNTSTSITLNTVDGCEYSNDGSTWVTNPEFDGLTQNTTYTLYQRRIETDTYGPSGSSSASFSTRQKAVFSLEIISNPTKTDYVVNEKLDLTGIGIKIHYDDNSYITKYGNYVIYTISPAVTDALTILDDGEVTVSFSGKSATFIINVERADYVGTITDPLEDSKTYNSITLTPVAGYEYSSDDGANWTDDNVFTGLSPDLTYSYVQRVKQTDTYKHSGNSHTLSITTDQAPPNALLGTVQITGNAIFGESLTVGVSGTNELGTLVYQWQADGVDINGATSNTFTLNESEIASVITVEVRDTDIGNGNRDNFIESSATATVDKQTLATPNAPTKQSATTTSIILSPTSGYEYRKAGGTWQDSNVFSGLTVRTNYSFTQRVKGTTTTYESAESSEVTISTTAKLSSGGSSGGSSDGSSGDSTTPIVETETTINDEVKTEMTVKVSVEVKDDTQIAEVDKNVVNALIKEAETVEKDGENVIIEISLDTTKETKNIEVVIPSSSFGDITDNTDASVKINHNMVSLEFDSKTIETINDASSLGDVSISVKTVDIETLSEKVREILVNTDVQVFDFTVTKGFKQVSDFDGGYVKVAIPYTPKEGQDTNALVVYFLNDSGELEQVQGSYDPDTGNIVFKTDHFSKYLVGYNLVIFEDVKETDWFYEAVTYIGAREIVYGRSEGVYAPSGIVTRAEFATLMVRIFDLTSEAEGNYRDVEEAKWYYAYIGTAKANSILPKFYNDTMAPDTAITREEMMYMLYKAMEKTNQLDNLNDIGDNLSDFTDIGKVSSYAKEAFKYLVSRDIINGNGNGTITPTKTSTRAEVAQMLYNIMTKLGQ